MPIGDMRSSNNQTAMISKLTPKKTFEKKTFGQKHVSTFDVTGNPVGLLSPKVVSNSSELVIPAY